MRLLVYTTSEGHRPFVDWFERLGDREAQARVMQRLDRLQAGNFGDCRSLGGGLLELRIDVGPGYRVYFAYTAFETCVILFGGSKRTQQKDIKRAREWLSKSRKSSQ